MQRSYLIIYVDTNDEFICLEQLGTVLNHGDLKMLIYAAFMNRSRHSIWARLDGVHCLFKVISGSLNSPQYTYGMFLILLFF